MKKNISIFILTLLGTWPLFCMAEEDMAIKISSCLELQSIQNNLSGRYELINDIDCTELDFSPIGTPKSPFMGELDGKGYKISNLHIDRGDYTGLFGLAYGVVYNDGSYVAAIIKNLELDNIKVNGTNHVGGLIGKARNTSVSNIKIQGKITGKQDVGGVIGDTSDTITLNALQADGLVLGENQVGGLIGMTNASVSSSHANVQVSGSTEVGGLIGSTTADISYSDATGNIIGKAFVGGLVGRTTARIYRSYATGGVADNPAVKVTLSLGIGGLAGYAHHISDSYASGNVTLDSANLVGGMAGCVDGNIDGSHATGNVNGRTSVGGLIGGVGSCTVGSKLYTTNITTSYATGNTKGNGAVGGFIGHAAGRPGLQPISLSISNSYARGNAIIKDIYSVGDGGNGGLIGMAVRLNVLNCYSSGEINGPFYEASGALISGGLIGIAGDRVSVQNSYWDMEKSGISDSAGGIGKRTIELFQQTSFLEWDFNKTWDIKERKGYPILKNNPQ